MDTIKKYLCCALGQWSTPSPLSQPSPPPGSKITSALLNSLADSPGAIVLVHENRKVEPNVADDDDDIRIGFPDLDRICTVSSDPRLVFISICEGVTVFLKHDKDNNDGQDDDQENERLAPHCRGMALTGTVQILFDNEVFKDSLPPSYTLSAGDRLFLATGTYYIRASTECHSIYLNKKEYLTTMVQYYPANVDDSDKLMQFVQELPDYGLDFGQFTSYKSFISKTL